MGDFIGIGAQLSEIRADLTTTLTSGRASFYALRTRTKPSFESGINLFGTFKPVNKQPRIFFIDVNKINYALILFRAQSTESELVNVIFSAGLLLLHN